MTFLVYTIFTSYKKVQRKQLNCDSCPLSIIAVYSDKFLGSQH